jgi:ABC-type branched-subunit amino acid transport system permease subunit
LAYSFAMGIVMVTIVIAACCMSVWSNFDPAIGPSRLLTAFEAVAMGGLGSLWGTLAGGIMLGVAQNFGAQFDAAWQTLAQHLLFLVVLALRPQGLFSKGRDGMRSMSPAEILALVLRAALMLAALACVAGPWLFSLNDLSLLTEFFTLLTLALMWNLLAGYADIISVGQHAFVGIGAYAFYGLTVLAKVDPWMAIAGAMVITFLLAIPAMAVIVRLRMAYLAVGTWVVAEVFLLVAGKLPGFGGGSGVSLPIFPL